MHQCVCPVIDENHGHDGSSCILVLRIGVVGAGTGPAGEDDRHTDKGDKVLCAPSKYLGEEGSAHTSDQVPTGQR